MSTSSKLAEFFVHPLLVGSIAYFGSMVIDGTGRVNLFGTQISMNTYYALTTAGASLAGQSLKQWILPMLPNNGSYVQMEAAFLLPALTGVVNGAAWQLLSKQGFTQALIIGGGSEIAGTYLYDNVIKQYIA